MIINRALIREILQTSAAVTLVMLSIFLVVRVVGFLRQAAAGDIPVDSVIILLLLKLVNYMDVILPLILYVAILMVLGRWNRDNEMTVIAACGVGLANFLRPMAVLFLIIGTLVAVFSLYLSPLAVQVAETLEEEFKSRTEVSGVMPGVFVETSRGRGVYFVEEFDREADEYHNIFIYSSSFDKDGVVVARSGYRYIDELTNDEFIVLQNGTRYEGKPGQPNYRIIEFESYAIRIEQRAAAQPRMPVRGWTTAKVFASDHPRLITEWHWRLAKPVSLPTLMIFALAFSNVNVRRNRLPNMLAAFVYYFAYVNTLGFAVALMKKEVYDPSWGLWWVHGLFLVIAVYAFMRRSRNRPFFPSVRLRAARA